MFTRVIEYWVTIMNGARGKGHHEHRYGLEKGIDFTTWRELIIRFRNEVKFIRSELHGNESKKH